jgi:hypothetical protein
MITFTTFWCYTKLAHRELRVSEALSAMYAFQKVQQPLFDLPDRVMFYLWARVSMRRLERFFAEDELEGDHLPPTRAGEYRDDPEIDRDSQVLAFHGTTHVYPKHEVRDESLKPFKLRCPEMTFPKGKLTIVYGDNASGKTSLLMACLGGAARREKMLNVAYRRNGLHRRTCLKTDSSSFNCHSDSRCMARTSYNTRKYHLWRTLRRGTIRASYRSLCSDFRPRHMGSWGTYRDRRERHLPLWRAKGEGSAS